MDNRTLKKWVWRIGRASFDAIKVPIKSDHRISILVVVWFSFAYSFGEYYYTIDPALPKWNEALARMPDQFPFNLFKASDPITIFGVSIGLRPYHLFPMLIGYYLIICFFPLIDDLTAKRFENKRGESMKLERIRSSFLGVGNLSFSLVVEDFGWFFWRFYAPLQDDPRGGHLMQAEDWTSRFVGCSPVGSQGFCIPNWYFLWIAIAMVSFGVYLFFYLRASTR